MILFTFCRQLVKLGLVVVHDFDHFPLLWILVARNIRRRGRRTHMQPHNRKKLDDRVIRAAEAALAAQKYVSPVDVLGSDGSIPGHSSVGSRDRSNISRGSCRPICRAFPRP